MPLEQIRRAYHKATGRWRGCDWPTSHGEIELNLAGVSAADAQSRAERARENERAAWESAACWLERVECAAEKAEMEAALALAAANAGDLTSALAHAKRAGEHEHVAGRPDHEACWHGLEQAIEEALKHHGRETLIDFPKSQHTHPGHEVERLQDEVRHLTQRLERLEKAMACVGTY